MRKDKSDAFDFDCVSQEPSAILTILRDYDGAHQPRDDPDDVSGRLILCGHLRLAPYHGDVRQDGSLHHYEYRNLQGGQQPGQGKKNR